MLPVPTGATMVLVVDRRLEREPGVIAVWAARPRPTSPPNKPVQPTVWAASQARQPAPR